MAGLVGGISCCLGAAALYLLGRNNEKAVEALESITRVERLRDLANKVLPSVVAISGKVGSDTPINCKYRDLQGVIVQEEVKQLILEKNEERSWDKNYTGVLSTRKTVPWYLDDGIARVKVVGASGVAGLLLDVGSSVYEDSGRSHDSGLQILGVKRVEFVLPIGTRLTVVCEAFRDETGDVWIQTPAKGPFYIAHETIDKLIADQGEQTMWLKYASMGLATFGFCLIAFQVINPHWDVNIRVLDADAPAQRTTPDNA
ncbi:E3 ubiquitin-protein ligase SP1-like [Bidens hawaiensis]|uniref:E3 ubiquitin-protein ligase SP1-like n=1 Tax=Bidens hawaiensis TaxID=980011 RepID=UPI004049E93F